MGVIRIGCCMSVINILAFILGYMETGSLAWAFLDGFLGWIYILYYIITHI